jgi:hypothetical protein
MSAEAWERGSWMQTFTGRRFYPLAPSPDDVDPIDIAHALSLICRYGGHTRRFYSVAEHCVLMSYEVPAEDALWALLHDATEAYVGDMVRPLKHHMADYIEVEDRVAWAISERFDLDPAMPASVKAADNRILLDERAALLTPTDDVWDSIADLSPLGVTVVGLDPLAAEYLYRQRLDDLTGAGS